MILSFLNNHKTKITGIVQAALGAAILYLPQLQAVMKPIYYGLSMMGIGTLTAVLGFLNSRQAP